MRRWIWRVVAIALAALPGAGLAQTDPLADLARLKQSTNAGRLAALREILTERKIPFEAQSFDGGRKDKPEKGTNLSVSFGSGPREIVVGAHYDAVMLKDGTLSHGMVDNGASVITLVRLAEALRDKKLRHPVRLLFFDQEELGLLGSQAYIASKKPGEIAAAINLDVNGYGDTAIYGRGQGEASDPVVRSVERVCAESLLDCERFPVFPPGDDRSFEKAGIPNVSIAFVSAVEARQLWLLLNGGPEPGLRESFVPLTLKTIHTPGDALDKIQPATLDLVEKTVLEVLLQVDASLD
ncbi:MAG TPA: M20/M25/M40 family metallo-hydrolase [Thermoanaerobaculia bacterium]|nr:M20/M25/M40 family metallo-hydrolase [Thermoanaerobaculia bacterium]